MNEIRALEKEKDRLVEFIHSAIKTRETDGELPPELEDQLAEYLQLLAEVEQQLDELADPKAALTTMAIRATERNDTTPNF